MEVTSSFAGNGEILRLQSKELPEGEAFRLVQTQ